jgi:hypothetical protein
MCGLASDLEGRISRLERAILALQAELAALTLRLDRVMRVAPLAREVVGAPGSESAMGRPAKSDGDGVAIFGAGSSPVVKPPAAPAASVPVRPTPAPFTPAPPAPAAQFAAAPPAYVAPPAPPPPPHGAPAPAVSTPAYSATLQFGRLNVDERLPLKGEYGHLDLSLYDVRLGSDERRRFKFKLASYKGQEYLEFRHRKDWAQVFYAWPEGAEDSLGKLLKLPDAASPEPPKFPDPRDSALVAALIANLESIVAGLEQLGDGVGEDLDFWKKAAHALSHGAATRRAAPAELENS